MKQIIITIIIVVWALPLVAGNANIDRANQAYKQELYNEALKLYLQEAQQTGVSSALYCNIGDTYYRLKDNVHAVLYYERALLLDSSNSDARFNLEFVRGKMQLPILILTMMIMVTCRAFARAWAGAGTFRMPRRPRR